MIPHIETKEFYDFLLEIIYKDVNAEILLNDYLFLIMLKMKNKKGINVLKHLLIYGIRNKASNVFGTLSLLQ